MTAAPTAATTPIRVARRRAIWLLVLAALGLFALVYAADVAYGRHRLPRRLTVEGVQVGGLTERAAHALLTQRLSARLNAPVEAAADGVALTIVPKQAGLGGDYGATFRAARVASLNPLLRLRSLVVHTDVRLRVAAEEPLLRAELERQARTVDRDAHEGAIRFDGITPVVIPPQPGRSLQIDAAMRAITRAFLRPNDGRLDLAVATTPVKSSEADVEAALHAIAEPAVAAPVTFDVNGEQLVVTPAEIAQLLRIEADSSGHIVPTIDPKDVTRVLDRRLADVETKAQDAKFRISGGKVVIQPSRTGREVDPDALARDLVPVLAQPAPRTLRLALVTTEPELTIEKARALGIKEQVSSFTTQHPCCRPRVKNIHLMADIVDGAVVLPGETFSLNGFVGERDAARGFVEAPMILDGEFVPAVGGGVSQFATTMFNAVFFGGFEDVFHKPHSYYITRYPAGREATVSTPSPDLKWRNDSTYGVLITTAYTDKTITVSFWSTKRWTVTSESGDRTNKKPFPTKYDERPECSEIAGHEGFDIVVTRIFKKDGEEVRRQRFMTRYKPEPKIICGKDPGASPSPSPSASGSGTPNPQPS